MSEDHHAILEYVVLHAHTDINSQALHFCAQYGFISVLLVDVRFEGLRIRRSARRLHVFLRLGAWSPTELITRLNQGPGVHIRAHAYQYDRKIRAELARIARIREVQLRAIALLGSAIVALFIAIGNFGSNYLSGMVGATSATTSG